MCRLKFAESDSCGSIEDIDFAPRGSRAIVGNAEAICIQVNLDVSNVRINGAKVYIVIEANFTRLNL